MEPAGQAQERGGWWSVWQGNEVVEFQVFLWQGCVRTHFEGSVNTINIYEPAHESGWSCGTSITAPALQLLRFVG